MSFPDLKKAQAVTYDSRQSYCGEFRKYDSNWRDFVDLNKSFHGAIVKSKEFERVFERKKIDSSETKFEESVDIFVSIPRRVKTEGKNPRKA